MTVALTLFLDLPAQTISDQGGHPQTAAYQHTGKWVCIVLLARWDKGILVCWLHSFNILCVRSITCWWCEFSMLIVPNRIKPLIKCLLSWRSLRLISSPATLWETQGSLSELSSMLKARSRTSDLSCPTAKHNVWEVKGMSYSEPSNVLLMRTAMNFLPSTMQDQAKSFLTNANEWK